MPRVSVVIPAYNSMTYLPETVESVLQQTFTDFEVLIVDDGSADAIEQWAATIADSRVRFVRQSNQGVSVARNLGITQAQGEYIAFLDADDLWECSKLEKQVRYMENHPTIGLVHSWVTLIDAKSRPLNKQLTSTAEGTVWQSLIIRNAIACCSVLVRRECFATAGLFDPLIRSAEDWEMWIRIALHYPIGLMREPLARYRVLPTSKSKNIQLVERSIAQIIEKTFQSIPSELLHLKSRSYGYAYFYLAWKALQSKDKDVKAAIRFCQQAIEHSPNLRFSSEYLRLSLAIALMRGLGSDSYSQFLNTLYRLKNFMLRRIGLSDRLPVPIRIREQNPP